MINTSVASLIRDEHARTAGGFIGVPDLDEYLAKLEETAEFVSDSTTNRCRGFVAFYCNDLVTRQAYITLVLVSPVDRGVGLGRTLVDQVLAIARQRGFVACRLEVNASNGVAYAMYRALGFEFLEDRGRSHLLEVKL